MPKKTYNINGEIIFLDVSPNGEKMAFVFRGKLFISDVVRKVLKEIPKENKEAAKEVKWIKDKTSFIYSRSYNCYYNWFTVDADNEFSKKELTKNNMNYRQITFDKEC
jgi:tricorn protease